MGQSNWMRAQQYRPSIHAAAFSRQASRTAIADWRQSETFPQFVPHPTTWLNRGSWADEHYSYSKQTNGKKSYTELMREYLTEGEEENGFDIEGTFSNLTPSALLCANGAHNER
jgi:hypothetical protein